MSKSLNDYLENVRLSLWLPEKQVIDNQSRPSVRKQQTANHSFTYNSAKFFFSTPAQQKNYR